MPSKYSFTEYSFEWPSEFSREADTLRSLLGDELVDVHHIGSTSVPGLAAKPIIDLLPVVRSVTGVDDRTPLLQDDGYRAWGEYGLPGRRLFTKDHGEYRTHNAHIYAIGNPAIERHLAFCAYLRSDEAACKKYETLKRSVYAQHHADIDAYCEGKDVWLKKMEPLAVAWFQQQPVEICRKDIGSPIAAWLIRALNAELTERYPEDGATHFRLDPDEVAAGRGAFFVAYARGQAVGCGAVRRIDADTGEIKRMYVVPVVRGQGIGRQVLEALEAEAQRLGLRRMVLETGTRQGEALALYARAGYAHIPRFGEYVGSPLSVCMAKKLDTV